MKSNPAISYSESLYSLASFTETFNTVCFPRRKDGKKLPDESLSGRDMGLLIKWLDRDCGAIVTEGDVGRFPFSHTDTFCALQLACDWISCFARSAKMMGLIWKRGLIDVTGDQSPRRGRTSPGSSNHRSGQGNSDTPSYAQEARTTDRIYRIADRTVRALLPFICVQPQLSFPLSTSVFYFFETQLIEGRCQQKAKYHLSLSQKPVALSHLKSKRALEDLLLKRIATSQQLQAVLQSIDQAKGDIEIMAAYSQSTTTLKSILSHPSLDLDHVERTTDELAEVMASQEEVDSAIRLGGELATAAAGKGGEEVDDDELRKELEAMVSDQREEDRRAEAEEARVKKAAEMDKAEQEKGKSLEVQQPARAKETSAEIGKNDDDDKERRRRYEDAQQRQKEEAVRAEAERMRKAERVAAAAE